LISRVFGCVLLCAAALPAFAQPGAPIAEAMNLTAASVAPGSIQPLLPTSAFNHAAASPLMAPQEHAITFAGNDNRLTDMAPLASSAQSVSGSRIQNLLQHAMALLGTPYRWGGTGTDGFDCSGLVGYVFRSALGIELPRVSREMASSGQLVSDRASLSPGDLVFFGHRGRVSHVGIYVGEGRFLHAPRTGRDVTVSSLDDGYWGDKFLEARRVAGI
jgi:cell wall-associated NlpC family hydrolase